MIEFFVPGIPVAKGSAKAFYNKKAGRAMVVQTNADKQKPWASSIAWEAKQHAKEVWRGPLRLYVHFTMPRPKSHYGTGKNADNLKDSATEYHTSKPDLDKLIRCVKDALTGVVWNDDSQVCDVAAYKMYGAKPGVEIAVIRLDEPRPF